MKKNILCIVLTLLVITTCIVGCNSNIKNYPTAATNLYSVKDLNICLGYGVLLPKEDSDEIVLSSIYPIFEKDFAENPKCMVGVINDAILIFDEFDLHIKLTIKPNRTNKEEIESEDNYEKIKLGNMSVIKTIVQENIVKYKFIDRAYCYEIDCDFKDEERIDENTPNINNKSFEENTESLETFISNFKRYQYCME